MRTRFLVAGWMLVAIIVAASAVASSANSIVDAVKTGNRKVVRTLLLSRADVNVPEADGTTALHWAVRADDVEVVSLLLRRGAKVNAANRYGITPLLVAATNGNPTIVEQLLKAGANPNATWPENGETVLMTAARTGNAEVIKALGAYGVDLNARERSQGQTALMWAAAENHPEAVKALVEIGADINVRTEEFDGKGPARHKDPKQIAQQGTHTTFPRGGLTALLFAARQGATDAVSALADVGVDLNQADPDGFTPMILAILNGHYDLAALLVERGAGIDAPDVSGRTPLFAAVDMHTFEYSFNRPTSKPSGKMDAVELVKFLLAHGANPNARLTDRIIPAKYDTDANRNLSQGATPLMKAASTADVTLMRILLDAGALSFIRNAEQSNAMMVAAGLNWRLIYSLGSEADAIAAIKMLLDCGMDINSYNNLGQTVLHAATMRGRGQDAGPNTAESENLVMFLVAQGAKLDTKDKLGRTPLDMAVFMQNDTIAGVLRQLSNK